MLNFKLNVFFKDKKIKTNLSELVQYDYNSVKLKFTFDIVGIKYIFKLINPDNSIVMVREIKNNELIFGPGVLDKEGYYFYEISVYDTNSKLTNYAKGNFFVREILVNTDDLVEPDDRVPVLDQLINDVNTLETAINANEETRNTNEQVRITNENTRITNETARQSNEIAREDYIDELKQDVADGKFDGKDGKDGEDGYTPQKGIDYYTEEEKEEMIDYIVNDANSDFNQNVTAKTTEFNTNSDNKIKEYNDNATSKTTEFNTNASDKTTDYNNNATTKLSEYNTNASTKLQEYNTNADNKIAEFDAHSEELDNKIIVTRNELERVKNDVLETGTDTDTYIHLEDSAMAEYQELSIDGVCEQASTTGKNFLPNDAISQTKNGITFTVNKDGSIKANGTANGNAGLFLTGEANEYIDLNISNGDYILSGSTGGSGNMSTWSVYLSIKHSDNTIENLYSYNGDITFSKIEGDLFYALIRIQSETQVNNQMFYPMIRANGQPNTYEPFTNGQQSPSPDYPQPISTIENSFNITSCNKNILNKEIYELGKYIGNNGVITNNIQNFLFSNYERVKSNSEYTIGANAEIKNFVIAEYDKDKNWIKNTIKSVIKSGTFTTENNTLYVRVSCNYNYQEITKEIIDTLDIQLEENSTATSYEQHLETQITANLPEGEFIGKIDDTYKDTLKVEYNEEDGQYHLNLYKNVGKKVYKGSNEGWWKHTSNYFAVQCNGARYGSVKCTNFISDANASKNKTCYCYGNNFIRIKYDECETLTDFITWLSTHNTEVYYKLATPYILDLGIVDMPITYNEITNLFTDSDLMPTINAKYYRTFEKTIQILQVNEKALKQELIDINNRLSALETAQTNVMSESEDVE